MLLAALIAVAPATVDYSTVAKPLSTILSDLSAKAGVEMRASKAVQDDLIVVSVRGVAIEVLRDRIADAVAGNWEHKDGLYTLQRDESEVDKRAAEWLGRRVAEIQKAIDDSKNVRIGFLDKSVAEAVFQEENLVFPMYALGQMLTHIGLEKIASIGPTERVVFSTRPTAMQQPLRGCEDLLRQVYETHIRIAEIAKTSTDDDHPVGSYEYRERQHLLAEWKQPLRAVIIVEGGQSNSRMPTITGYVLDASGKIVENVPGLHLAGSVRTAKRPSVPSGVSLSQPIEMTPASDLMARLLSFDANGLAGPPEFENPRETLDLLRKPTQRDPLSFHISEALRHFGVITGKQVVARLSDDMVPFTSGGQWTPETFITEFLGNNGVRWTEAEGWLTISPADPKAELTDRRVLENFIAATPSEQSLREIADFAQKSPPPWSGGATLPYFRLFAPGLLGDDPTWAWLRVYAALSEQDRLLAENGIDIASLSAGARKAIERVVFFSPRQQYIMGNPAALGWDRSDLRSEPTEMFPLGLPPRGVVHLSHRESPVAFVEPRPGSARPPTPYTLGTLAHTNTRPEVLGNMDASRFRIGTQLRTTLRCEFATEIQFAADFWTFKRTSDTTVYNLQTAPADFRKAYDEAVARIR